MPVEQLSAEELLEAREELEIAYEEPCQVGRIPGGEPGVRKMLRAIRYALGPNCDRQMAVSWSVLCIVVPEVTVVWKDGAGQQYQLSTKVGSCVDWKQWVREEVQLFRDYIWRVSWGRVLLKSEVMVGSQPVKKLEGKPGDYRVGPKSLKPLLTGISDRQFISIFAFGPMNSSGKHPGGYEILRSFNRCPQSKRAFLVWVPATEERIKTRGRLTNANGGLRHEFWHTIEFALKYELNLKNRIWIPSNEHNKGEQDLRMLKREVHSQGLPEPKSRYDELYAMWPTWHQCHIIAARYGAS